MESLFIINLNFTKLTLMTGFVVTYMSICIHVLVSSIFRPLHNSPQINPNHPRLNPELVDSHHRSETPGVNDGEGRPRVSGSATVGMHLFPQDQISSCSRFTERNGDALPDPAGREQRLCKDAVEGVQPHLSLAVVRQRPGLIVQQHPDAQRLSVHLQLTGDGLLAAGVPRAQLPLVQLQAPGQLVHPHHAALALLLPRDVWVRHAHVGPRFGHLQLPVVLAVSEALQAQHLPGVVEAGLVGRDGAGPGDHMLRPPVALGEP